MEVRVLLERLLWPFMHTLLALFAPVFSAFFLPVSGGELTWTQQTTTTAVIFEVDLLPACTAILAENEALSVAEVMIDVIQHNTPGKLVVARSGDTVRVSNIGSGNIQLSTNNLATCRVTLRGGDDEPKLVSQIFTNAGL